MVDAAGRTTLSPEEARAKGMTLAVHARGAPDRPALLSRAGDRSFGELNARANRLVRALRAAGLAAGDAIALLCSNRPEFVEVLAATQRAGWRFTPINWHASPDEIAYVVDNCEARAFVADARYGANAAEAAKTTPKASVRLAIGGPIAGFDDYERALAGHSGDDIADPLLGGSMLYTSGTTGRPKGVYRRQTPPARGVAVELPRTAAFKPGADLALCTGPLYHAAPLAINLNTPLAAGVGVVLMDGWDAAETLRLVERHRITHTHMVATMFHRLLALPDDVKRRHDLSSLRYIVHGAAPTPPHVKQAMMDWLGPVLYEYYAATEGGGTFITPEEWLRKPGSVGRPMGDQVIEIRDDAGAVLPPGEVGTIWFKAPDVGRFEYFKDQTKTAGSYAGDFFTLRDMGYFDADGYLFLTGRTAEVIISGGVNIYPAEVDAALLSHPAVADAATVGAPNEEWGEEVRAVVQLESGHAPSQALADELIAHCRARLAHFKCPRRIDFDADLPRHETGKIYRRLVRDRYWQGRERKI
jgi:long-chain acyl-CoA synthetase